MYGNDNCTAALKTINRVCLSAFCFADNYHSHGPIRLVCTAGGHDASGHRIYPSHWLCERTATRAGAP